MIKIGARDNEQTQEEIEFPESNNPRIDIKGFRSIQGKGKYIELLLIF